MNEDNKKWSIKSATNRINLYKGDFFIQNNKYNYFPYGCILGVIFLVTPFYIEINLKYYKLKNGGKDE